VLVLLLLLSNLKVKNENNSKKGVTEKVRVPLQVHFVLSFFFFFFFVILLFCVYLFLLVFFFFFFFIKKLSREKKGIWLVARARARARADFRFVRFGFWGKGERCCDCEEW
jgi:uncharacterized membrane protein